MTDKNDPLAPLLALAESASKAKQLVADATAKFNAAKMEHVRAVQANKDADDRAAALNQLADGLASRSAKIAAAEADLSARIAKVRDDEAKLAARAKELADNEARVATALETARASEAQAKTYEGESYEKLQAVRAKLGEIGAL